MSAAPQATTLLVLDDSPEDREILRRLLSSDPRVDYVIHEFTDIETALEGCRELGPDCVLLDYSLGDGTGLDFLKALHEQNESPGFPVIMLTGSGSEEVAAQAFRTGVQDYLAKGTITPGILQRTISSAIYKARTERLLAEQRIHLEKLFQEAKEANARKDQFLAALSHELRTPLTPILSAVSGANPHELSRDELEDVFTTVRRNVLLEARLIDDLLDLTRIAKGKLRLDLYTVNGHEVLRHALDTCADDIAQKKLEISIDHGARFQSIFADPARLQQIFWNLLKNAVKFTPEGGSIHIATSNPSEDAFEISIRDSGIGIAPEVLPNIFKAFEQGSPDIPKRFGGLGLGLAITHALVEAHHGSLRAESAGVNQGATFVVGLQTVIAGTGGNGMPSEDGSSIEEWGGLASTAKSRILLVEDHADTARQLRRLLERSGYEVLAVHNIADAVSAFSREHVDAIVSDIGLPDGDGVEVMQRVSQIRPIPAIALSGYGSDQDIARSRDAGFSAHLVKPIEWSELERTLHLLLNGALNDQSHR